MPWEQGSDGEPVPVGPGGGPGTDGGANPPWWTPGTGVETGATGPWTQVFPTSDRLTAPDGVYDVNEVY